MLHTVLQILQIICCIGVIATVLLQSGRSAGLSGSISGGAETFLGKKGLDDQLAKASGAFALLFMVLSFVLTMLIK
ncbi:MAG: preprotein translocase subunit SecG [Peptococcaceae bacterium]|jgi:preprotein translocase subunit SecG|nr:preprotein translocase subunit SecG [Peptococcaceae bacterium]